LRDRRSNTNTGICFEVRATALRPRLHTEEFQLSTKNLPQRNLHWEITITNREETTPLSFSSIQEEGTKPSIKQRKEIQLSDPMMTNLLVISKDYKQFFSQKLDPKDRFRIDSSSMW